MTYRGRFAPTPSGALHQGSLLTALASYLEAHRHRGQWLLRIDDLDTPRNMDGAEATILQQLEAHGLVWDETPRRQSEHHAAYQDALAQLQQQNRLYPCVCTRADLRSSARIGRDGAVYAGTCRHRLSASGAHALRLRTDDQLLRFDDAWQGVQTRDNRQDIGDFVVRRTDGQIAYQLACVIDEAAQDITDVVRGADLLGSTFRQQLLQQHLGLPTPRYRHLPVLTEVGGHKLSKQNHAAPIRAETAAQNLLRCLHHLQQSPPSALSDAPVAVVLEWARAHWNPLNVPKKSSIQVE